MSEVVLSLFTVKKVAILNTFSRKRGAAIKSGLPYNKIVVVLKFTFFDVTPPSPHSLRVPLNV